MHYRRCPSLISLLFFICAVKVAFSESKVLNETLIIEMFESGNMSTGNQSFMNDDNFTIKDATHQEESFFSAITSEIQTNSDDKALQTNDTLPTTDTADAATSSETKKGPLVVTTIAISRTRVITEQDILCLDLGCECPDPNVESGIFLDCSGRRIRTLPDRIELPATLSGITFQKNDIRVITRHSFSPAPKIEELDFAENSISQIDDDAFEFFESLVKLRLSHNQLRKLSSGVLRGLDNLRVLEIDNNAITELSASLFAPATNLQEVRMQKNKLSTLRADTFKFLDKLAKLDLSDNGIQALPPDTFEATPLLNWLSLTDNSLQDVPRAALSKAKRLHSLDLSGNRFVVLREGTFESLDSVSCLYLNNIATLERIEELAFANMTTLKTLHINFNKKLSYIHSNAFGSKIPVDQLSLSENALETLPEPEDIGIWARLSHADLSKNPWVCDCNLRWMKRAPQEIFSAIRCESPLNMHGRSFAKLDEADLECYDSWMISSVILGLSSLLVFSVCSGLFIAMIYSRSSIRRYVKARSQFMYSKVPPKIESVDLEWDPSADA